ncbi:MAG: hypothetical protein ACK53Y_17425 [bacterium]
MTSDAMHLRRYLCFRQSLFISVALERAGRIPLFSLYFLSKFLSKFELSYSYVRYHVSSYVSVLGCQAQSF